MFTNLPLPELISQRLLTDRYVALAVVHLAGVSIIN